MDINVRDFGVVGDGRADDTAAFQAALNAVPPDGAMVGSDELIVCLISAPLQLRSHTTLDGETRITLVYDPALPVWHDGQPLALGVFRDSAEMRGVTIARMSVQVVGYDAAKEWGTAIREREMDAPHTYPDKYPPGTHWSTDAAWEILDTIRPGVIPDDVRAFLAGQIAGRLMAERDSQSRKV